MSHAANQPGYYRKLATILLRIVASGYGIQGLCWALRMVAWSPSDWDGWLSPVFDLVSAAALWVFSPRLAKLVARALDE